MLMVYNQPIFPAIPGIMKRWRDEGRMELKNMNYILRNLSLLGQMGLSFAVPLLLCLFLCSWLIQRFSLGSWIYIPGFFFGMGGSCMTAYKLYQSIMSREKKEKRERAAFNEHR
jgi:hypothetical protein